MKPCGKRPPPIAGKHEHDSVSYRGITRRIAEEDRTPRWEYNTFCQDTL